MRVTQDFIAGLADAAGTDPLKLNIFEGEPMEALVAFVRELPPGHPLKPFTHLLTASLEPSAAEPVATPVPTQWMIKQGDEFVRVTTPPALGTLIYGGPFVQQDVTVHDAEKQESYTTKKWVSVGEVTEKAYDGEGDNSLIKVGPDSPFFMLKEGNLYRRVESVSIGAEVFYGTFQPRGEVLISTSQQGGDDYAPRWAGGRDVTAHKYCGSQKDIVVF
jgi:hypothetical protein